ncbi:helicase-exonuclease AddAB subunit AddB [Bacillus horti]|uniref:ATP-dependent helicase/deoxyribonuclease subunit B n=1 Tax=Caldalkalibacillus horti TaxID=77523 RepID=A0ABT9W2F4_9BACI|nr:helicase-exonuclease AddAB subunit AddB [Bacillus horti]MDQ0167416.1 ATP-dependent helicase/nuclease subunit B [Bacillus horti]
MSIQFVLGRAGSGKTTYCVQEIKQKLLKDPLGKPIIYIVPEQMSYQAEIPLVKDPELNGMIRAQVYSISRLAFRVLSEVGGVTRTHLDQVGITMILRKIIEKRKDELYIYKRSAEQQGFYTQLEQMITEFKRYCIAPEELFQQKHSTEHEQMLKDKLHDLQLIYQDYEQAVLTKYMDSEDFLKLFQERMIQSSYLREAELYMDGFYQFTPQEQLVLEGLFKLAKKVTITLPLDQIYDEQLPNEMDLFYSTAKTYQDIKVLARQAAVKVEQPIMQEVPSRLMQRPSLMHLEAQFDQRPVLEFEGHHLDVQLSAAVNRRAEIEGIARQMIQLVREDNYRWRDLAMFTRNLSIYQDVIATVFHDYDIPVFIDQKKSMLNHPLIELLRSVLEVLLQNWRYEAIFRCIKTDLLSPILSSEEAADWKESCDRLENFVLANGINGTQWTQDEPWKVYESFSLDEEVTETNRRLEAEQELQRLRQMIVQPIIRLKQGLKESKNVRQSCEHIYFFMEELGVYEKLEQWRVDAEQEGRLQDAREHDQVWKGFIHLLEQMVEISGDEPISLELLSKMIETGCEQLKFSTIPPSLDQVMVGSLEVSRLSGVKQGFVLGMNDGMIPARFKEETLMTEEERAQLYEVGLSLAPGLHIQLSEEYFYLYMAMCSASDGLHLSYSLADEEGKALTASSVLQRIKQMFPQLTEKLIAIEAHEVSPMEQKEFVVLPKKSLSILITQLRQWKKGYPIVDFWWDVYNWFVQSSEWSKEARTPLASLFYRNIAHSLSLDASRSLYGEHIQSSVSRMELYRSCPFSHFASYGLKLKERKIFRLEAPDIGQLFHSALKEVDDELRKRRQSWSDLSLTECQLLAKQAVDKIANRLRGNILASNHRNHYIKYKLQQVVERASQVLYEHAKVTQFTPVGMEIGFGPNGSMPALHIPLDNDFSMDVVGRIDRVDQARSSEGLLLRVIDFKSSKKDLQLTELYHGLSLQMLTYLDVLLTHSKGWLGEQALPAGVLYFHLHNPMLSRKTLLPAEKLEKELYRQFKMKGLLVADKEIVQLMDTQLETQHSDVIPVGLKKDGSFYSQSKVASPEEFTELRHYVRKQMKEIGTEVTNGSISITPFKMKQKIACTFCPYKSVCHYDQSLEENTYTQLKSKSSATVIEEIRASLQSVDQTDKERGEEK